MPHMMWSFGVFIFLQRTSQPTHFVRSYASYVGVHWFVYISATDAFCALVCLVCWGPLASLYLCNGRILCARMPRMLGSIGFFIFLQRAHFVRSYAQPRMLGSIGFCIFLQRAHFVRSYAPYVGVHRFVYIYVTGAFCALVCPVCWGQLASLYFCNGRILCARMPRMLGSIGFFIFLQRAHFVRSYAQPRMLGSIDVFIYLQRASQRTHFVPSYHSYDGVHWPPYISTTGVTTNVTTDAFCAPVRLIGWSPLTSLYFYNGRRNV
jgi:hypothetical protein